MIRSTFQVVALATSILVAPGCESESKTVDSRNVEVKQAVAGQEGDSRRNSGNQLESALVEASCGQCQFGMEGKSCDLAIRHNGKTYFVDGSGIDDHGDAHGEKGLCNCIRRAQVSGELKNGRFQATSFKIVDGQK